MEDKAKEVQKVWLKSAVTPQSVNWSSATLASGVKTWEPDGRGSPRRQPQSLRTGACPLPASHGAATWEVGVRA